MVSVRRRLMAAWRRLLVAYLIAFAASLIVGLLLIKVAQIDPRRLFELSGTRIAKVVPLFEMGMGLGLDLGLLLFVWNSLGALVTLTFIHTVAWFDPQGIRARPRFLRAIFVGGGRMKLLCHLPGCAQIADESVRRAYVWLMVPWLGLILLGLESGLQVATAAELTGSMRAAILALATHGIIEIPAFALAGAVPFAGHWILKEAAGSGQPAMLFATLAHHRQAVALKSIALCVLAALLVAGMIEAHLTPLIMGLF